jgi:hypothetical protein
MPHDISSGLSNDEFEGYDPDVEHAATAAKNAKKAATKERTRQRGIEQATARRQSTGGIVEPRAHSVFQTTPEEGPGGQQRLFSPQTEPEAFETKWAKRARTERVVQPRRTWADIRPTSASKGRGVSQESVRETLAAEGVTTRGAKQRLRSHLATAQERAGEEMPKGQAFYAHEQADRFEQDAKHFGVPFHVALAVNAVMSPKTALATARGYQTNREAAHLVLRHVTSGKTGVPNIAGKGLRANAVKAAEIVRQHLEHGTHPLDAVDSTGKHLLSGPKVEEYYSSYIDPSRAPTDIQHSRVLFGPKVRSELSPEENVRKDELIAKYGRNSPEVGRYIPKSPAEVLLGKQGVHEWAHHVTSEVAVERGLHPSELQTIAWHEHKTRRAGPSAVAQELQPLFASRKKPGGEKLSQSQFSGMRNLS